jgi:hypothetical protein
MISQAVDLIIGGAAAVDANDDNDYADSGGR